MEKELHEAAIEGSVETLQKLIQQDDLILRRYISGCFMETPLHIAAMFGHLEFTKSILAYMPEMAKELDSRDSTPLHIATAHGHILIVKELLSVNPEMCSNKDWEGRNPVHIAVIKGHIEILKELVQSRPEASQTLLGRSTILHLCVKHNKVEALRCILEVIPNGAELVNFKDEEGFTILHSAVAERQTEIVKFLLQEHRKIDVNAINKHGFSAWDISLALGRKDIKDIEIAECFQEAGKLEATSTTSSKLHTKNIICSNSSANDPHSKCCGTRVIVKVKKSLFSRHPETESEKKKRLEDTCNALMIVASIMATVTFQALMQPPHQIEQADSSLRQSFLLFNTLCFSATIFVMLLLISGFPMKSRLFIWILRITMWIAVFSSASTYLYAMKIFKQLHLYGTENEVILAFVVVLLIIILALGHAIRILFKMVRCFVRWVMKRRRRGGGENSNAQGQSCV